MLELILESPITIGVGGLIAAALAGYVWTQTGQKSAGRVGLITLVLTLCMTTVGVWVETDQEKIRIMLHTVAAALQRNDQEYVYSQIHPKASATVQRARTELPNYKFVDARVTRIKAITIDTTRSPETAIAEFNVVVALSREGFTRPFPRFIKLYLAKLDGQWLVRDYEHSDASDGFLNKD